MAAITEGITDLLASTWWFSDVTFAAGMGCALNTDSLKAGLARATVTLNRAAVISGMDMPQHLTRSLDLVTPRLAYNIIKWVLLFCVAWNTAYNYFVPQKRNALVNLLFTAYSLLTVYVSAHDVLLHSDRKEWAEDVKRRHVLFPINLEANKVFPERLNMKQRDTQLMSNNRLLKSYAYRGILGLLFAYLWYKIIPNSVFFLACPVFLPVHRQMLLLLDHAFDSLSLLLYRNRYDHWFGDIWAPVHNDDKHDYFGRQYQYFNYSSKALEKVAAYNFYKPTRAMGYGVAEAKAAYYMGRCALVCTLLFIFNMVDIEGGIIEAFAPIVAYYGIHASFAYWNHGKDDKFDDELKRSLMMVGEMLVSGYLFYKPILDHLSRRQNMGAF